MGIESQPIFNEIRLQMEFRHFPNRPPLFRDEGAKPPPIMLQNSITWRLYHIRFVPTYEHRFPGQWLRENPQYPFVRADKSPGNYFGGTGLVDLALYGEPTFPEVVVHFLRGDFSPQTKFRIARIRWEWDSNGIGGEFRQFP